jgi:hypothetical protein
MTIEPMYLVARGKDKFGAIITARIPLSKPIDVEVTKEVIMNTYPVDAIEWIAGHFDEATLDRNLIIGQQIGLQFQTMGWRHLRKSLTIMLALLDMESHGIQILLFENTKELSPKQKWKRYLFLI